MGLRASTASTVCAAASTVAVASTTASTVASTVAAASTTASTVASTVVAASTTASTVAPTVAAASVVASTVASTVAAASTTASNVVSVVACVVAHLVASAFAIAFDAPLGLTRRTLQRGNLGRPVGRYLGRSPAIHCFARSLSLSMFSPAAHRLTRRLTRRLARRRARAALRVALPERCGAAQLLTVAPHGRRPLGPLGSREQPRARRPRPGAQSLTAAQGGRRAHASRRPLGNLSEATARTLALVEEGA